MGTLIVIAKAPVPGRVKTRLTPPFSPDQAAALARAALADTLAAVAGVPGVRRLLVLEGAADPDWLPAGFEVVPQAAGTLDRRLAAAFAEAARRGAGPALLVGMDTPQVTAGLVAGCLPGGGVGSRTAGGRDAAAPEDAVFGPAADGGFWALGFRRPGAVPLDALLLGVPMSTADTGAVQLARLRAAGLRVRLLPELRDVDTVADAEAVAALRPDTRFAAALRASAPLIGAAP